MIASFMQVFIESFQRATAKGKQEVVDLSGIGIASVPVKAVSTMLNIRTMLATIGVKGVL